MPKIKTHKAIVKRFKITKNNKIIRRKAGQDHFNAKQTGKIKRKKRRDILVSKVDAKNIRKLLN